MSYKFTRGAQVIGDLKAADDTERNTLIDFGEDQIDFQTSGSVRLQVSNNGVYIPDYWGPAEADRLWCFRVEVRETQSNMAYRQGHRQWNEELI